MFNNTLARFKLKGLSRRESIVFAAVIVFVCTFLVLFLFQPFGEVRHGLTVQGLTRIFSYAFASGGVFLLLQFGLLPRVCAKGFKSSLGFWLIWYGFLLMVVTVTIFLVKNYWMGFSVFSVHDFLVVAYRVLAIAIVPGLVLLALAYNRAKERVPEMVFRSQDRNPEYLKLAPDDVIAISSEDNYVEIRYCSDGVACTKLLRNSLGNVEPELPSDFVRIHRGHIINLTNVETASCNSQGGWVTLRPDRMRLRISRNYRQSFLTRWREFSESPG